MKAKISIKAIIHLKMRNQLIKSMVKSKTSSHGFIFVNIEMFCDQLCYTIQIDTTTSKRFIRYTCLFINHCNDNCPN